MSAVSRAELEHDLIDVVLDFGLAYGKPFELEKRLLVKVRDEKRGKISEMAEHALGLLSMGVGLSLVGKRLGASGTRGEFAYERKGIGPKRYQWTVRKAEEKPATPATPQPTVIDNDTLWRMIEYTRDALAGAQGTLAILEGEARKRGMYCPDRVQGEDMVHIPSCSSPQMPLPLRVPTSIEYVPACEPKGGLGTVTSSTWTTVKGRQGWKRETWFSNCKRKTRLVNWNAALATWTSSTLPPNQATTTDVTKC